MNEVNIKFKNPSSDYKKGFEAATIMIYGMFKNDEGYTIKNLDDLLSSMITLMKNNMWWPDIKEIKIVSIEDVLTK